MQNPSFEQLAQTPPLPADWYGDKNVYTRDESVVHSGKASLRFVNHDADRYALCSQNVKFQPGAKYAISVWVKTKEIVGSGSGATVCVEWQDAHGKHLGGIYPSGVSGTRDWKRITAITRIPRDAAKANIKCYVRKGLTGTAWFDDVQMARVSDPPMQSMVLSPVYRGRITKDGPREIRVRMCFDLIDNSELKPADLKASYRLCDAAGKEILAQSGLAVGDEQLADNQPAPAWHHDIAFPTPNLPVGKYRLQVGLTGLGGKELQSSVYELERMPDDFRPKVTIDEHLRLLVDGKPFFPLGMYWHTIKEDELSVYAQSKFNCLMPYGSPKPQQMDLAQKYGVKVIYSVKDMYAGMHHGSSIKTEADEEAAVRGRVRQYRDHPALLAWYLNDELPLSYLPRLEAHERWVAEDDPQHPAWVVLYQYNEVFEYRNTFDVIGTDPYPIGRGPASRAAHWTAVTFAQVEHARPMWQVPQLHNWANYEKNKTKAPNKKLHTPTFDEVHSMAWQCIAEGATGLVFYSWYDMKRNPDVSFDVQWDGMKRIAAEIDRLAPAILSIEEAPQVKARAADGQTPPSWLHLLVRRHQGKVYVFAVNDGDGEGRITLQLPFTPREIKVEGTDSTVPVSGPEFQAELPKLAVQVYEITP